MKKYIYLLLTGFIAFMGSCSKESPFDYEPTGATGQLLKSSVSVSLEAQGGPRSLKNRNVRMAAPSENEFGVDFIKVGESQPTLSYSRYADMPEIVTLPVGNYTAVAHYGENLPEAWDNPYYEGTSEVFAIELDKITTDVAPIICSLANVRVSVSFDEALKKVMSEDCKVHVEVGRYGSLDFTVNDTDKSGYFAYVKNSNTLAAVFTGNVDGAYANETKTYDDVQPGNHYAITFKLHEAGEEAPGNITGKDDNGIIRVDATVETTDENVDVDAGEITIPDVMRPQEGEEPGTTDPDPGEKPDPEIPDNPGDNKDPEDPKGAAPTITADAPIVLDADNLMTNGMRAVMHINSEAGIEEFTCEIQSQILKEELGDEFPSLLNLAVTPADQDDFLTQLGFPTNVKGSKYVKLELTEFIPLLITVSDGRQATHTFVLRVKDANGTVTKTLKLHN